MVYVYVEWEVVEVRDTLSSRSPEKKDTTVTIYVWSRLARSLLALYFPPMTLGFRVWVSTFAGRSSPACASTLHGSVRVADEAGLFVLAWAGPWAM